MADQIVTDCRLEAGGTGGAKTLMHRNCFGGGEAGFVGGLNHDFVRLVFEVDVVGKKSFFLRVADSILRHERKGLALIQLEGGIDDRRLTITCLHRQATNVDLLPSSKLLPNLRRRIVYCD